MTSFKTVQRASALLLLALLLVLGGTSTASAQPQNEGDVIILFDGSGSMLARVDGEPKVDTARRVA
ncbi:MAG: hypothetical protein ACWA5T_06310, partial [Parvularcula sp.]